VVVSRVKEESAIANQRQDSQGQQSEAEVVAGPYGMSDTPERLVKRLFWLNCNAVAQNFGVSDSRGITVRLSW
jgi:hypothetical protein